jgi:acyl carrier protein phosphodiesterase
MPLAAVHRHLALPARNSLVRSLLAARVVADPSQLLAQTFVLGHVLHGVVFAAVDRHSASGTLRESAAGLEVRGARLARREVASSGVFLCGLYNFAGFVVEPLHIDLM